MYSLRALLTFIAALIVASSAAAQAPAELEARLRTLEKRIGSVRGLAFKTPVKAKVVPRAKADGQGVQGYYSVKDKTLFVYDDVKDSYKEGVLIHEMVHALQDQHFDLAKLKARLHVDKIDDDAELALAALIEGDATYTMIEVLKADRPKVAAMLDAPLEKAKNLHNAFLYAQGARYVKALKERGGWASVNFAYKFPPGNTASILSLRSVSSIDLGPGPTHGAYRLFNDLNDHPDARKLALPAAQGWRGDRVVETKNGKAWVFACADQKSAAILQGAFHTILDAKPGAKLDVRDLRRQIWTAPNGTVHALMLTGANRRLIRFEAAHRAALDELTDQIVGPLKLSVVAGKDRKPIPFGEFIERLLDSDIVCIGESHDAELHHRVQLQIIKGLFAFDERLGVGMEMFQRPFQLHLDGYVGGAIDEAAMLKGSEYDKRWGYDWSLYQPIVDFCRRNRVPLAGLNAGRELTGRISKVGYAGLNDEEKKLLGPIDFQLKPHRDYWYERLAKLHGSAIKRTPEEKERSYQVMTVWDDYMAASAAQFQQVRRLKRMIVLAGSGHIDRGFGIPLRAARRTGGKAVTVKIAVGSPPTGEAVTDYVVIVR